MLWLMYALLSAATWGIATIFVRLAIERVDTTLVTTIRTVIMGIVLMLITFSAKGITRSSISSIATKDWLYIAIAAITSSAAWLLYFGAFKHGYVSKVVSVDRLSFVLIMLVSVFLFDEPLTKRMIFGAGFMVLGIFLIASK